MNFPSDLRYTKDHEWIRVEGNVCTVGVTDHAQGELGDIVYIDVTSLNKTVAAGETIGAIEAVKTVADLYSPCSGTVLEANPILSDSPESVNRDPYGDGWMVKIELSNPSEVDSLMSVDEYKDLIGL